MLVHPLYIGYETHTMSGNRRPVAIIGQITGFPEGRFSSKKSHIMGWRHSAHNKWVLKKRFSKHILHLVSDGMFLLLRDKDNVVLVVNWISSNLGSITTQERDPINHC